MKFIFAVLIFLSVTTWASHSVLVPGGSYKPILGKGKILRVPFFYLDETAVTNRQYLDFVKAETRWKRTQVKKIFADQNYLKHWKSDEDIGQVEIENSPVVNVSWFAARAYCQWKKQQLPTVDQWEYVAQFGPRDTKDDIKKVILEWYSKTTPTVLPNVKSTFKNKFGIWDIHGLIWEWTLDFNTTFVTGESRGDTGLEKSMYCGSGSLGAANPNDYASFMRFGFRSSLKAHYTVANLGFRCAGREH